MDPDNARALVDEVFREQLVDPSWTGLLCPRCHGVTVEHTLRRMKELSEENASLREQIAVCLREYVTLGGSLSIETRTKLEAASRAK